MTHNFWHQKWQKNEIGFHLPDVNPLLVKHLFALNLKPNARIFLPLCGKTLDISWLLAQGYQVAGAELSEIAIKELFKNLNLTPTVTQKKGLTHYQAPNIDIFVGDIFKLSPSLLGTVDLVYDRAALVALPDDVRKLYTAHLMVLTQNATQLLICFEYDQSQDLGPPFSVDAEMVKSLYQTNYTLTELDVVEVDGGLKGKVPAKEKIWQLKPKQISSINGALPLPMH